MDTIYRQWLTLQAIPRAPRKIDGATLERILAERGFDIHRRSIQRDLMALSFVFPLVCDDCPKSYGPKSYGWS